MGAPPPEMRVVSTQFGDLVLVAGSAGVSRVVFPPADAYRAAVVRDPGRRAGPMDPEEVAQHAARELAAYFEGEIREFSVPVDLGAVGGFRRRVLEAAREIPFGETAAYKEIAIAAGSPGAVRAAGTAIGANPVPILIPCHRVIRSDGSPGLYGGGEQLKRELLDYEADASARAA